MDITEIRKLYPEQTSSLSDADIINRMAQATGQPVDYVSGRLGVQRNQPGFWSSARSGLASYATGLGTVMEDMGAESLGGGLRRYGEDVQFRNPSSVNSFSEFAASPWQGVKEFTGQALGSTGPALIPYLGQAGRAASIAGTAARIGAGTAISSVPAYGEIAQKQQETGEYSIPARVAGSLGTGLIEQAGGIQRVLRPGSAAQFATDFARTPFRTAAKAGLRTMAEEGAEELAQSPIQQYAGGQDPLAPEQLRETAFSGFAGAVGSLGFGGFAGARAGMQHSQYNQSWDAAQAERSSRIAAELEAQRPVNLLQPAPPYQMGGFGTAYEATQDPQGGMPVSYGEFGPEIPGDVDVELGAMINPYDMGGYNTRLQEDMETGVVQPQYGLFGGGGDVGMNYNPAPIDVEQPAVTKPRKNAKTAEVLQQPKVGTTVPNVGTNAPEAPSPTPYSDLYRKINPAFQPDKKLKYSPYIRKLADFKTDEEALTFIRDKLTNSTEIGKATAMTLEEMHKQLTGKTVAQWQNEQETQSDAGSQNVHPGQQKAQGAKPVQQVQAQGAAQGQRPEGQNNQNDAFQAEPVSRPWGDDAMGWVFGEMQKRNPEQAMVLQMSTGRWDGNSYSSKQIAEELTKQGRNVSDSRVRQLIKDAAGTFESIVKTNNIPLEDLRDTSEQATADEDQLRGKEGEDDLSPKTSDETTVDEVVQRANGEEDSGPEFGTGYTVDSINKVNEDRSVQAEDKNQAEAAKAAESNDPDKVAPVAWDAGIHALAAQGQKERSWSELGKTPKGRETRKNWLEFFRKVQTSPARDAAINVRFNKTIKSGDYYSNGRPIEDFLQPGNGFFKAFFDFMRDGQIAALSGIRHLTIVPDEDLNGRSALVRRVDGSDQLDIVVSESLASLDDANELSFALRHEFSHVADMAGAAIPRYSYLKYFDPVFEAVKRVAANGPKILREYFAYPFSDAHADLTLGSQRMEAFAQLNALWTHRNKINGRKMVEDFIPEAVKFLEDVTNDIQARGLQSRASQGAAEETGQRDIGAEGRIEESGSPNEAALPVDAWHGTPHNVHENGGFTTQKIGTGEGAQAYGWGMYFSSMKKIAQWYREKLSKGRMYTYDGQKVLPTSLDAEQRAKYELARQYGDKETAVHEVKKLIDMNTKMGGRPDQNDFYRKVIEAIDGLDSYKVQVSSEKGRLYNVELAPDEHEFLDWDARSYLQPNTLERFLVRHHFDLYRAYRQKPFSSLYTALARKLGGQKEGYPEGVTAPDYEAASKALFAAGIPGIKYRGRTSSETNYVIFDDSLVKIKEWESKGKSIEAYANYPEELQAGPKLIANIVTDTLKNWAKKGLQGIAFGHDLENIAVDEGLTTAKKFFDVLSTKSATRTRLEAQVDDILERAAGLSDRKAVNSFLKMSTSKQVWGYQPKWKGDVEIDDSAAAAYSRLSDEGKKVVDAVFKHGSETYDTVQELLNKEINSEYDRLVAAAKSDGEKAKLERDRQRKLRVMGRKLPKINGPYAPLGRFGDYVAVGKSQAYIDAEKAKDAKALENLQSDPNHYVVEFYDSYWEAKARARDLQPHFAYTDGFEKQKAYRELQEVPWGSISKIKNAIDDMPGSDKTKAAMNRLVTDIYLTIMVESSARKSELRRKNVAGAERDMLRSFASQGRAMSHFVAALQHSPEVSTQISAMQNEARDGEQGDRDSRTRVLNEVLARYAQGLDFRPTPVADKAMRVTSFWMLVTSPGYYVQNSLQTAMLTLPMLNARFGTSSSWKAMFQAYKDVGRHIRGNFNGNSVDIEKLDLIESEKALLRRLRDNGRLDITIGQDLGRWSEGESITDKGVFGKVMRQIWAMPQRLEMINRITSALAAHRLGGNFDYVSNLIDQTHGNYAASNAPRFMQGTGLRKLVFQFRKYQLIQASLIAKLAYNSFANSSPEEKAVARSALKWILAHHMVMAGALGMPAANLVGMTLAAIGGDDNEPKDAERMLRKAIGDEDASQLMLRGLPAVAGLDLSTRVGMQNAFALLPFVDINKVDRTAYEKALTAAGGAFLGGLLPRWVDGVGYISKGDYYKGLEQLLPKGFADMAKAYRMGTEGVTQRNNDVAMKPDELSVFDVMSQAVGLPSTTLTDRQRRYGDVIEMQNYYKDRTAELRHRYAKAYRDNDMEEMRDLRDEWSDVTAAMQRNGLKPTPLSSLLQAPQQQSKREANIVGGVPTTTGNRRFVEMNAGV